MNPLQKLLTRACLRARDNATVDRLVSTLFQWWYDLPVNPFDLSPRHDIGEIFRRCYAMPFPPTHYYSPLPHLPDVKKNFARWYKESTSPGIDWNLPEQIDLAESISGYAHELVSLPTFAQVTQEGYGLGYGEVEGNVLYMMMRHLKPSSVVEVGSGVSTFYTLSALRTNRERDGVEARMTCIEPYPSDKLRTLVSQGDVHLRALEVQDVDFGVFEQLSANDVLFIDSSHVSKIDSDVNFLYLEVLPRLRRGVGVHIHDMPFPMPALPRDHPLFDNFLFWNEAALVKAFLLFNTDFKITMCQSYLHYTRPEVLKKLVPAYDPRRLFPASLWLQKVR